MTYAFEFNFPHIEEGSKEAEEQLQKLKGVSSIQTIIFRMWDGKANVYVI